MAEQHEGAHCLSQRRRELRLKVPLFDQLLQSLQKILPDDVGAEELVLLQFVVGHKMADVPEIKGVIHHGEQKVSDERIHVGEGVYLNGVEPRIAAQAQQGEQNIRLAGKMVGQVAHADAHGAGDVPHGHGLVALLVEKQFCGLQDLVLDVGFHSASP